MCDCSKNHHWNGKVPVLKTSWHQLHDTSWSAAHPSAKLPPKRRCRRTLFMNQAVFPDSSLCLFSVWVSLLPCWVREQPDWAALARAEETTELLALLMAVRVCGTDEHGGFCGQSHLNVVDTVLSLWSQEAGRCSCLVCRRQSIPVTKVLQVSPQWQRRWNGWECWLNWNWTQKILMTPCCTQTSGFFGASFRILWNILYSSYSFICRLWSGEFVLTFSGLNRNHLPCSTHQHQILRHLHISTVR